MKRRSWVRIHRTAAILLGLLWALQALTGTLLVFGRDIDATTVQASGSLLPPETLVAVAQQAAGHPVSRITQTGPNPIFLEAYYRDGDKVPRAIRFDGSNGEILGDIDTASLSPARNSPWRILYNAHAQLFAGGTGQIFIGINGAFLLVSLLVGAKIACPRKGQWRGLVQIDRWRSSAQRRYGWHRLVGMLVVAPLCLIAATGIYISFIGDRALLSGDQPLHVRAAGLQIGANAALQRARARIPQGRLMSFELPRPDADHYVFRFTQAIEWRRWTGRSTVIIDAHDGRILGQYDPAKASWAEWVEDQVYPVHIGEAGGLVGQLLVLLLGVALCTLLYTGLSALIPARARASPAVKAASLQDNRNS